MHNVAGQAIVLGYGGVCGDAVQPWGVAGPCFGDACDLQSVDVG